MVEIDPRKQQFLSDRFGGTIFCDATDMDQDCAPTMLGSYLPVPKAEPLLLSTDSSNV